MNLMKATSWVSHVRLDKPFSFDQLKLFNTLCTNSNFRPASLNNPHCKWLLKAAADGELSRKAVRQHPLAPLSALQENKRPTCRFLFVSLHNLWAWTWRTIRGKIGRHLQMVLLATYMHIIPSVNRDSLSLVKSLQFIGIFEKTTVLASMTWIDFRSCWQAFFFFFFQWNSSTLQAV